MLSVGELKQEWRVNGRLLYGLRQGCLPYELFIRGFELMVAWYDDYPKSVELEWALIRGDEVIKRWDYSPTLTDLFDVQRDQIRFSELI